MKNEDCTVSVPLAVLLTVSTVVNECCGASYKYSTVPVSIGRILVPPCTPDELPRHPAAPPLLGSGFLLTRQAPALNSHHHATADAARQDRRSKAGARQSSFFASVLDTAPRRDRALKPGAQTDRLTDCRTRFAQQTVRLHGTRQPIHLQPARVGIESSDAHSKIKCDFLCK